MATTTPGGDKARPLSPHLQIYRWPVTMATSIVHRATGIGNTLGAIVLTGWLVALTAGEGSYALYAEFLNSLVGRAILVGFTWSLVYHLCNGVRHLVWDTGHGFAKSTASFTGILVFLLSIAGTVVVWLLGYASRGGLL